MTDKVAIVTGGSRGIGRATAVAAAARGFRVVVGYASNKKAADEVEGEDPALAEKLRMAAADFDAGCDAMQEAWSAIYEAAGSEMPARKKARAKEVLPSCLES